MDLNALAADLARNFDHMLMVREIDRLPEQNDLVRPEAVREDQRRAYISLILKVLPELSLKPSSTLACVPLPQQPIVHITKS